MTAVQKGLTSDSGDRKFCCSPEFDTPGIFRVCSENARHGPQKRHGLALRQISMSIVCWVWIDAEVVNFIVATSLRPLDS